VITLLHLQVGKGGEAPASRGYGMAEQLQTESVSVFFPAYNDAGSIATLVKNALKVLNTLTDDYEVIVINDGSTDDTPKILDDLAANESKLKIIHHEHNRGYGAALRSGFKASSKDLIFYTDGDGQYDVKELKSLHALMTKEIDVVNGFKIKRSDKSHRKILGGIYNRLSRFLFRLPIRDVDCDFRLIRQSAIQKIELESDSGVICVELITKLKRANCLFIETPVNHYPRAFGSSQFFTLSRVARTGFDLIKLWLKLIIFRYRNSK
jgi:glycosyltransferase involved in cell wall biosynthesis